MKIKVKVATAFTEVEREIVFPVFIKRFGGSDYADDDTWMRYDEDGSELTLHRSEPYDGRSVRWEIETDQCRPESILATLDGKYGRAITAEEFAKAWDSCMAFLRETKKP